MRKILKTVCILIAAFAVFACLGIVGRIESGAADLGAAALLAGGYMIAFGIFSGLAYLLG